MFIRLLTVSLFLFTSPLFASSAAADKTGNGSKSLLSLFVIDGGPIVWYVLIPMSVLMLFVVMLLCFTLRKGKLLPAEVSSHILMLANADRGEELAARLADNQDIVSKVMADVIRKSLHINSDEKYIQELAKESLNEQAVSILRKVEWCGIIGNVAPMIGLFGTVYGMIQAFDVLGSAGGQPRPDQLAAKISIALVTTFWGLLIAIPSLVIHGIFRSHIEGIAGEASAEIDTLLRKVCLDSKGKYADHD